MVFKSAQLPQSNLIKIGTSPIKHSEFTPVTVTKVSVFCRSLSPPYLPLTQESCLARNLLLSSMPHLSWFPSLNQLWSSCRWCQSQNTAHRYINCFQETMFFTLLSVLCRILLHCAPLQIIIVWNSEKPPPHRSKWPPMPVPLVVTDGRRKVSVTTWGYRQTVAICKEQTPIFQGSLHDLLWFQQTSSRFLPHAAIETEAVLSLDEDSVLLTSEVRPSFLWLIQDQECEKSYS